MDRRESIQQWTPGGFVSPKNLLSDLKTRRRAGQRIVTTNGCFDVLHPGHLRFLAQARSLGDLLIVGLNSDASVHQLKGAGRPLLPEAVRAEMLASLSSVSYVVRFDDFLPIEFLAQVKPHFHCKAGDYDGDTLPEAAVVRANCGEVRILPITAGFSTSQFIERVLQSVQGTAPSFEPASREMNSGTTFVIEHMLSSANVLRQTAYQTSELVVEAAQRVSAVLSAGGKILLCGNGGSAADAQHIAAELVGRFKKNRRALAAIALTTDTSILTAVSNDFGFDHVFSRQVMSLGHPGDILFALSTSGNSPNVVLAARTARERGLFVIGLTSVHGSTLERESNLCLCVPSIETLRVQQAHITLLHLICELTEIQLEQELDNA